MTTMSVTTTSGHTLIPGKWTHVQEPMVVMVPLTQAQLVALTEALPIPTTGEDDLTAADDALWAALDAIDEHEGIQ